MGSLLVGSMDEIVDILLIEDNPADARLLEELLNEQHQGAWQYRHAEDLTSGLALLKEQIPDVILLDLDLPDITGMQGVDTLTKKYGNTPIVILSGRGEETTAIEAVQHGASDYVVKGIGDGDRIWQAVCFAIARFGRARTKDAGGMVRALQVPVENHLATLLPHAARHEGSTVIVSVARPFREISPAAEEAGIKDVFFIDAASGDVPEGVGSNVTYVDSPTQLEKIMMRSELVAKRQKGPVQIVVDSVNMVALYNDEAATLEFAHALATRCRANGWGLDLVLLRNDDGDRLLKAIGAMVDSEAVLHATR